MSFVMDDKIKCIFADAHYLKKNYVAIYMIYEFKITSESDCLAQFLKLLNSKLNSQINKTISLERCSDPSLQDLFISSSQ